jgi:hypothetical protein
VNQPLGRRAKHGRAAQAWLHAARHARRSSSLKPTELVETQNRRHTSDVCQARVPCSGVLGGFGALHSYVERAMTDEGLNDPKIVAEARDPLHPYQRYLARALIDESEAAGQIFDEMVAMTEHLLQRIDKRGPTRRSRT